MSTRWGADASLLKQHLDGRLASVEYLWMAARFHLVAILYVEEALRDLGTFAFFTLHLFSVERRHLPAVAEILRLIKRMEELHTKMQGVI